MNRTIAWIASEQTKEISCFSGSNDVKRLKENLPQLLTSSEATIDHVLLSNVKISPGNLVESSGQATELHFGDRTNPAISATLNDDEFASNGSRALPHKPHSRMNATECLSGYHDESMLFKASEVYSITHQHFNLLLGALSVIYMRKRYKRILKEENDDNIQSWEIKIKFRPSWCFNKGFWARLWTNASGGCNVQQSLTVTHTVPSCDEIWTLVCGMDIASIRKEFMKKRHSVNTVDEYGRSLLGQVNDLLYSSEMN
jgi:hypothetical protein